ncbi:hypothetical protein ERJ75_001654900 [Trypanosoma vivax]|uniref:t-SNARE coiled-coil homology domain-containing protein n=1 Tax=Trypanosoma vivax (strain Y486) TaxID=1055687 RepID=G0U9F3_TRYVY|nr:hypothetical protein TRVL_06906 [Trypanosoma vivax]KAH8605001.1 hypothetical protein ERJ75_001654900 [Trypanosoma vivax]CCC54239.1 conserved hypothetical protein [Trypanosoma vivax Y486]
MCAQRSDYRSLADAPAARRRPAIPRTTGRPAGNLRQQLVENQIDLSGLATEEQIQREKLLEAVAIEVNVVEIKEATEEFASLLEQQRTGLDRLCANVQGAMQSIGSGREELAVASSRQWCGRKLLCFLFFGTTLGLLFAVAMLLPKTK